MNSRNRAVILTRLNFSNSAVFATSELFLCVCVKVIS